MTTTSNTSAAENSPDKQYLYGRFEAGEAWKRQLHRKGAYKALDIADDDMGDIHANRIGMTWKELAAIAILVGGSVSATAYLMQSLSTPTPPPAASPTPAAGPSDSEYEVRFYDAEGRPIVVLPLSELEQAK